MTELDALEASFEKPPGRRRQARLVQILKAAEQVFAENGFGGTTIAAVAAAANLPKANILYYFPTKESLYLAVLDNILTLWLGEADHWIVPEASARDALAGYVRAKLTLAWERPDASRVYAGELLRGAPQILSYLNTALRQRVHALSDVIQEWVERGELRPVSAPHLFFASGP